jgi:hypothetical protein
VITVESKKEQHQKIIQSTVAQRAYQLFERRGRTHGFDLNDWNTAEKELLCDEFNGDTLAFHFVIDCPKNPELTTILSLTTHSLVVFRSHPRHIAESDNGPDVVSVHVFPEEIDPTQADIKPVAGLLHILVSRKNHQSAPALHPKQPTNSEDQAVPCGSLARLFEEGIRIEDSL